MTISDGANSVLSVFGSLVKNASDKVPKRMKKPRPTRTVAIP
jgi:hypothetical protein